MPDIGTRKGLELIFKNFPACPHWPQFPKRKYEYFTYQFLYPLIRLEILKFGKDNSPYLDNDSPHFIDSLTEFYEDYLNIGENVKNNVDCFAPPREAAEGFYAFIDYLKTVNKIQPLLLKGQIIGPLSVGLQLYDVQGRLAFYNDQLRDLLVKTLEGSIAWQVRTLSQFNIPVLIFIDEGLLQAYGHREFLALSNKNIITVLTDLFNCIRNNGAISGIHVCSHADWDLVLASSPDVINFDAYYYFLSILASASGIKVFLEKGGSIAWGIVPASEDCFKEDVHSLFQKLKGYIDILKKHGIDNQVVLNNSMITPSCGTGLFEQKLAERVYSLTADLGKLLFSS